MKSTVVAALMLVPVLGLAGCGGGDSTSTTNDPTAPTTAPTTPAATDTSVVSPKNLAVIPAFKGNPAGIIKDTTTSECTTDPGTVTASGTVINTAPGPRDIAIAISWVLPGGSDVRTRGVIKLPQVPVNKATPWKVTATLTGSDPVQCVSTALRGTFVHPTGVK